MADPLSITASIVAVLQITSTVTQYLKEVKGGSEDRMRLRDEMRSTICLLEMLKDRAEDADTRDTWFDAINALNAPNGPLIQFEKTLELLVQKLVPKGRVQQVAQVLKWPFDKAEVREFLGTIERLKCLFSLAMQNDQIKLSQAIKNEVEVISKELAELQVSQKYQNSRLLNEENRNILNWISPLKFSAKQCDVLSRKQEGTCEWFLVTPVFQNWLNGGERTLWCPGIPGAGKTVLAATIIAYLQNTFPKSDTAILFIYCNYKQQSEQTVIGLIASLLRQLVEGCDSLPDEVQQLYLSHVALGTRPDLTTYSQLLQTIISTMSKVFVIIDALDESTEDTRNALITEMQKLPPRLHLLCTSRHIPDIEKQFKCFPCQEVRAVDRDVENYLVSRIQQNARLKKRVTEDPSLLDAIIRSVVSKIDGMFLLAELHLESLSRKHDRKGIRSALKQLPTKLDGIYNDALERIYRQDSDDVLLAERVLCWVSFAKRTLHVKEIQYAIAVQNLEPDETWIDEEGIPDEDLLVAVCAGMITIDKENGTIRLVHYTAQQYFDRIQETRFPRAEVLITQACLRYLLLDPFKDDVNDDEGVNPDRNYVLMAMHPFLEYAAQFWGHHAIGMPESLLKDQILDYLGKDSQTSLWNQMTLVRQKDIIYDLYIIPGARSLWMAAAFGLKEITQLLLEQGVQIESRSVGGKTALNIAVLQGHTKVAQVLLDHNADIENRTIHGKTALHSAAVNGDEAMVRLLLERGANINSEDSYEETALFKAAEGGHLAIVELLLQNGANVQPKDYYRRSPLDAAIWAGHYDVCQLLLNNRYNAMSPKHVVRALFDTAQNRHATTIEVLIDLCRQNGISKIVLATAIDVCNGSSYHIVCDACEIAILDVDVHFRCNICNNGDFDLCQTCIDDGKFCSSDSHQLVKRTYSNGEFVEIAS